MPAAPSRLFLFAGTLVYASTLVAPPEAPCASSPRACLVRMTSEGVKVAKAQDRDIRRCLSERSQNLLDATGANACRANDTRRKVAKARAKAAAAEAAKCGAPPAFGFAGARALGEAAATEQLGIADEIFGADFGGAALVAAVDPAGAACQAAVLRATGKVVTKELKQFAKCQRSGLNHGTIADTASLAACLDTITLDEGGKIAKAYAGVTTAIDEECAGVDLDATLPGSCAASGNFAGCLATRADCRACLMLSDMGVLGADCDTFDDGSANSSCLQCNGAASLCDRPFDEVVYPTSHNAMSNAAEGWLVPNQARTVLDQLDAGARALMLDTWYHEGDAVLCHGGEIIPGVGCAFTGMKPLDVGLAELTGYLDTHPNEVLSIIFESYITEADTAADFATSGLDAYVHAQPVGAPWPTLRNLITSGKRMIVFTDDSGASLPWHHYLWSHAWETHFSATVPEDFSCNVNRGSTSNPLFILNHFLTAPFASPSLASMVNHNPFFLDRAAQCASESDDLPNFVTVDFEDIGDLYDVVRTLNGLP